MTNVGQMFELNTAAIRNFCLNTAISVWNMKLQVYYLLYGLKAKSSVKS